MLLNAECRAETAALYQNSQIGAEGSAVALKPAHKTLLIGSFACSCGA